MNCFPLTTEHLFEQSFLTILARGSAARDRWVADATLFDMPREVSPRRRVEAFVLPEEDVERWDGLS